MLQPVPARRLWPEKMGLGMTMKNRMSLMLLTKRKLSLVTAIQRRINLKRTWLPIKPVLTIPPDLMTSAPHWATPAEIPKNRRLLQRKVAGFHSTRRVLRLLLLVAPPSMIPATSGK